MRRYSETGQLQNFFLLEVILQRDVLFFMVCHCAVSDSWIEPILQVIAENPKHYGITKTYMVMDKWADDPHSSGYGSGSIMKWNGFFEFLPSTTTST